MDNFEKKYNEALEQAKKELATCGSMDCDAARLIFRLFPELRESEDERIAEELIKALRGISAGLQYAIFLTEEKKQRWLAWLEKQKEQKPISQEDFDTAKHEALWEEQKPAECIEDSVKFEEGFKAGRESGLRDGQKYVLNNLDSYGLCKSAEWSEEDEDYMNAIIMIINRETALYPKGGATEDLNNDLIAWLKSLRPDTFQNGNSRPKTSDNWKPSEEKKKETLDGADIGYGLETAIDILENGFTHYQTDDGEYERKQALDVLIFLLNETRKKEDAKLWSKDIVESIVTWATEKLQLYSMKESTPYVEAVKNNAQKVLDWAKEQWPIYYGWKPSEEQMTMLRAIINDPNNAGAESCHLAMKSLYEQLEKM